MPVFKNGKVFYRDSDARFDVLHPPQFMVPASGIYRCRSCGFEIVAQEGDSFPGTVVCSAHSDHWHLTLAQSASTQVAWCLVAEVRQRSGYPPHHPTPPEEA